MLLFCCSDTHGDAPPRVPSGVELILHGGDVYDGPALRDLSDEDQAATRLLLSPVADWFSQQLAPTYLVPGNHDVNDPLDLFGDERNINGRLVQVGSRLWVGGVGWSGAVFADLPFEADLQLVCACVQRQARDRLTQGDRLILLGHYPAWLESTNRATRPNCYDCLTDLVNELPVALLIEGHLHQLAGQNWRHGNATVVSAGRRGVIVEIDDETLDVVSVTRA